MLDISKLPKSTLDILSSLILEGSPGILTYTGLRFVAGGDTLAELTDARRWCSLSFILADIGQGSRWYLDQSQNLHAIHGITLSTDAKLRTVRPLAILRDPRAELLTFRNFCVAESPVAGRRIEWKATSVPFHPEDRDAATGLPLIDRTFPDPHASADGWRQLEDGARFHREVGQ